MATASHEVSRQMPWPQKGLPWGGLPEETGPESPGAEGVTTHCSAQCAQSDWTVNEPTELVIGLTRPKRL